MRRSKVTVIALKRLSVLLAGSPAALWPPPLLPPQHLLLPVSQHAFCTPHISPIPLLGLFFLLLGFFFFFFCTPSNVSSAEKRARVHKFHILPQPVQFAITRFEAGAPPACMPSCFVVLFFFSLKLFDSLETLDLSPSQPNVMETTVVIWNRRRRATNLCDKFSLLIWRLLSLAIKVSRLAA